MSERLIGPDLNSRLAYIPAGGALLSAAGTSAVVFANPTGATLADIQIYNGTSIPAGPVPNSTLTVDSDSLIPRFWFPVNTDIVYIEVNGGTRTPANADYDYRVDNVSGFVNSPLLTTGLIAGGMITPNAGNTRAIDISPMTGYIVDYATDPYNPTITPIRTTTTITAELDAAAQTRLVTWWLMDSSGNLVQQANRPTPTQRRTHIQIGPSVFDPVSGVVFFQQSLPVILPQIVNQFVDLSYSLGAFNVTGNVLSPNGANLTFDKSVGTLFSLGFNHNPDPNDPHLFTIPARSPTQHHRATRNAITPITLQTVLDVANYDLNGVITPVGGGANESTNFRVFGFSSTTESDQIVVQYGQNVYGDLATAAANIRTGSYVVNPDFASFGALLGWISVIRTATDLSNPAQAIFTRAGKFDQP